jgi:hypothetical protein
VETLTIVEPVFASIERCGARALALPFQGALSLSGNGLASEIDWRLCGMLSRLVAQERLGKDSIRYSHALIAAAGFTRLEWILLYAPIAKSFAPALKALTELGFRDLAFAAAPLDEDGLQELTRIVRSQPDPVVFVLNASEAAKLRTRVGVLTQTAASNRGKGAPDADSA